jgi:hypothetical protein
VCQSLTMGTPSGVYGYASRCSRRYKVSYLRRVLARSECRCVLCNLLSVAWQPPQVNQVKGPPLCTLIPGDWFHFSNTVTTNVMPPGGQINTREPSLCKCWLSEGLLSRGIRRYYRAAPAPSFLSEGEALWPRRCCCSTARLPPC